MLVNDNRSYRLSLGSKTVSVSNAFSNDAKEMDTNGNGYLDNKEVAAAVLGDSVSLSQVEGKDLVQEFKSRMAGLPNPNAEGYHSFQQMEKEIFDLAEAHPGEVQLKSLGKTSEGRDIWALKISDGAQGDTSHKTGLVVTGCHHAREWMTVEAPLKLVHDILGNKSTPENQKRLKEAELWVIPIVNPDGYEFTRNENSWWRKNRRPLEVDQNGEPTNAIGVDLNRNYWDGNPEHMYVYRPPGDTPGNTRDDFSATSDNPRRDTYRGPFGGSEPEVKALLDLELANPNIRGVLDYHSYGDTILYPYGHTREESPNAALYKEIGKKMQDASYGWDLEQSVGLYPASGTSDDTHDLNGILNFTVEMGRSFQPNPRTIPETTERVSKSSLAFIDEMITKDDQGLLPPRLVSERSA